MAGVWQSVAAFLDPIFSFYERLGDFILAFYVDNSRTILDWLHLLFDGGFSIFLYITLALTIGYLVMAVSLLFRKPAQDEKPVQDKDLPFVTIQIPTHNELAALNCARRCLAFDYPKDKFEIIIGDDKSEKAVADQFKAFAAQHANVRVTRREQNIGFKPGNLNHMLKITKGEYLIIFDSDFLPKSDFLRRIIAPFIHDKSIAAVQARWNIANFSQSLSSVIGGTIPLYTHHLGLPFLKALGSNTFIAGSAEAIRVKDLKELGGWTSGCHTEDIEYSLRLTKSGKRILYLENLYCDCEAPFTVRDVCKQQMRWAYGVISASKMHLVDIVKNRALKIRDKFNVFLLLSGYLVTLLFFLLTIFGVLSLITHRPEPVVWLKFLKNMGFNILLTSGYLFATIIALILGKKAAEIPRMIVASFSVGLVVILVVTQGIFQALFGRPMEWFMLRKKGNEVSQ